MGKHVETRRVDQLDTIQGEVFSDPFRWLEDIENDEVKSWIRDQNAATEDYLSRSPLRASFRRRLDEISRGVDYSLPRRFGDIWVQLRRGPSENQPVVFWGRNAAHIEVKLIDAEAISEERFATVTLGPVSVSPNGRYAAFGFAPGGGDYLIARVREIETGVTLPDELVGLRMGSPVWNADSTGFFYQGVPFDPAKQGEFGAMTGQTLFFHRLGTSQAMDERVIDETPPNRFLIATASRCRKWLIIHALDAQTLQAPEIGLLEIGKSKKPVWIHSGDGQALSFVGLSGRTVYALSASGAPNGKIVAIDLDDPNPAAWRDVVKEGERAVPPPGAILLGDRIISVREDGLFQRLQVDDLMTGESREIKMPFLGRIVPTLEGPNENPLQIRQDEDPDQVTVLWRSVTIRNAEVGVNLLTGEARLIGQLSSPVDPSRFVVETIWARSADGTAVPVSLVHRDDVTANGDRPALVYAYGHGNVPLGGTGIFRPWWIVWLERGGVLALPHARGGGERGRAWYEAAFGTKKARTFEDCIAAVEALIATGWTRPARIAFNGQSGGGLTTGVVLTKRPDLFGCCVPEVGLYDLLRYHLMTYTSTKELGTCDNIHEFNSLISFSPQHAITPGAVFPGVMVMAGERDNRVHPGLSYKFAAALQEAQSGPRPILLRVQMGAGHATMRVEDQISERADTLAFIFDQLGLS